jgi:hypothetical protein
VFPRLQFKDPVELVFDPTGSRLWVLEVGGRLVSFPSRPEVPAVDLALDLAKVRNPFAQALGLAFIRASSPTGSCTSSMSSAIGTLRAHG